MFPDYNGHSIVNLMSSIAAARGVRLPYRQAALLPGRRLAGYRNIILLVIDGLGYDLLLARGKGLLRRALLGQLTSVFPATTASAVASFASGLAPRQHAVTGWFVYLAELKQVSAILLFAPRGGGPPFSVSGARIEESVDFEPLADRLDCRSHYLVMQWIADSDFSRKVAGKARRQGYSDLKGMLKLALEATRCPGQNYIYAYWALLDSYAHDHGIAHERTLRHLDRLCEELEAFAAALAGSGSALVVTADHGFIDVDDDHRLRLEDHPGLKEVLALPLCGEGRSAYCYPVQGRGRDFARLARKAFAGKARVALASELVRKGVYGPGKSHPALASRLGEYVLLMKDNYVLRDQLPGEKRSRMIGHHGGTSRAEMLVPLVFVACP